MSLTQRLTRSSPIVSNRPMAEAILSLVPTPSVLETSTGSRQPPSAYIAPKAPMPARTSGP